MPHGDRALSLLSSFRNILIHSFKTVILSDSFYSARDPLPEQLHDVRTLPRDQVQALPGGQVCHPALVGEALQVKIIVRN